MVQVIDYTALDEIKQNRGVFVRNRGMALMGGGFLDRCALPGIIGEKTGRIKKKIFCYICIIVRELQ